MHHDVDDDELNERRILIRKQSNKQQDDNSLYYLLTKQPENSRELSKNPADRVVAEGDLNLERTFVANYENLAKRRLAKWTQDDAGTDIVNDVAIDTKQKDNKTTVDNNNNNVPKLASNDDRCCYMTVYDQNMNRLEMVFGRKRSKHRPSTSLRPGYSGFFRPTEEASITQQHQQPQPTKEQRQPDEIIVKQRVVAGSKQLMTDNNTSERDEFRVAGVKKDFSPLFHNEYSNYDYKCDRAIENDIRYKHQRPRAHTKLHNKTDNNSESKLNRMNHPDCTCGSHYLLGETYDTNNNRNIVAKSAKERTDIQINNNVADINRDSTSTRKKQPRKRKRKVKSKRSYQDGKQQKSEPDDGNLACSD